MKITVISSKDTLDLRNKILRPGKPRSECLFEGDDLTSTRHFGAVNNESYIVGIVSIYRKNNPLIDDEVTYQIRAMAIVEVCRGRGVGHLLLSAVEECAITSGASMMWANARSAAVEFYIKAGYKRLSDEFNIEGVGPHFLIGKSLV